MEKYTFEQFWKDLHDGYQIYYNYLGQRYMISKLTDNCYSQETINPPTKSPHPKLQVLTLKRVKEIFPFMEDLEYKVIK